MLPQRSLPDPARARRVLAIAAITVAIAQLAVGLVLDAAPARVRFPQGAKVLERARALGGAPYVLLLGSSRFWQIDMSTAAAMLRESVGDDRPRIVQGAVPAGDPVVAEYLLGHLLTQGSHPALVAIEVSPETISRPAHWVAEHAIRFFTWRDVMRWTPEIVAAGVTPRVAAARFAPIHLYRRELLTWIVGTKPPYLRAPVPGRDGDPSLRRARTPVVGASEQPGAPPARTAGRDDLAERSPRRQPNAATLSGLRQTRKWLRHYRSGGGAAQALEHVLARCREERIRVVLVGVPVSSWVRELYTPEIERAFLEHMDRMTRSSGAEYVDYRARIPDQLFKDHHHVNGRGGELFARLLANEVLAPRWPHEDPSWHRP